MRKYTFEEFLAADESKDFDKPEEGWKEWAKNFVEGIPNILKTKHSGDCTKQPCPCGLCVLELMLINYKYYYFNEEQYRKENYG